MSEKIDYYKILGVEKSATAEEIKKAYRHKSKEAHPDMGGTEEGMSLLTEAYENLFDPQKRKYYDTNGKSCDRAIDFDEEAERFLSQLFDDEFEHLQRNVLGNWEDICYDAILSNMRLECDKRIKLRKRDEKFLIEQKITIERCQGKIHRKDQKNNFIEATLLEKLQKILSDIALAQMDIQILECAKIIMGDFFCEYKQNDNKKENILTNNEQNKLINSLANAKLLREED